MDDAAASQLRADYARLSAELRAGELSPRSPAAGRLDALCAVVAAAPRAAWPRLATAFNRDQVESKLWLIEHLARVAEPSALRVVVLGAWYGVLAVLMEQVMPRPPAEVLCVDLDEAACRMAERILAAASPRARVRCADMMALDHEALGAERATVFINTSCEHLSDFHGWRARVPPGARLVLQSNDHVGCPEHVNCVPGLDELAEQARLSQTDYRGTLQLERFRRFMLIGRA